MIQKKKVIAAVTNDLIYDQRMQRICNSLVLHGLVVELVGRNLKDSESFTKQNFQQTRLTCVFNKGFLFYAEFNIRLFIFFLFNEFDIVCGCDLDTLSAAVLAAKIKRKKVVYDAHEYFPQSPELIGKPFKQSIWYFIEKIFVPKVDALYTVTGSIAKIFNTKYKTNCKVIRNLPLKNNAEFISQQSGVLLYQGAVNVGRGLNEMLLVMLKLENVEFHIVGNGDEMKHISDSINELNLRNKVKLLGKKAPDELKVITQNSFIGINLLENRGLSYYYSLGNKTFDFIQAGIPQIVIGFPEYIELNKEFNFGLIVDELSVEKIYQSILKLINDEDLYQQLKQNCIKASVVLCWENEVQKLIAVYDELNITD